MVEHISSNKLSEPTSAQNSIDSGLHTNLSVLAASSSSKLTRSLDYWSKHNPLLMAEEIFFESREHWTGDLDFIFSCIGYSFGLGNTWRFPFNSVKHGGGSFLVAYLVLMIVVGLPVLFLELCLSQFTSKSITECWYFVPGFRGIGYSMILMSLFCCINYALVLGWILFYGINSLRLKLPFLTCDNPWNDVKCVPSGSVVVNSTNKESSSEQFWIRFVTTRVSFDGTTIYEISDGPQTLIWYSCSCMIISWSIAAVMLIKGGRVIEKYYLISMIFPYILMISIIILASNLTGSFQGFLLFIVPQHSHLIKVHTWYAASEQLFFSLGIGLGGMLTMGSLNDFHSSIQKHVLLIGLSNFFTALLNSLALFLVIGYMIHKYSFTRENLFELAGNGLIFFVFPECFGSFRYSQLTSSLFYFTIFILGIDSMLVMINSVIAGFAYIFPAIEQTKYHRILFVLALIFGCVIFSLLFVTKVGYNWYKILEKYSVSLNLIIVGLIEVCLVAYIYGITNFSRDYNMMLSKNMPLVWKLLLIFVTGPILSVIVIFALIQWQRTNLGYSFHAHTFPIWADIVGFEILILTLLPIPGYFIWYSLEQMNDDDITFVQGARHGISPNFQWGPMKKQNWMLHVYYKERLTKVKEFSENYQCGVGIARKSIVMPKWFEMSKKEIFDDDYSERRSKKVDSASSKFTNRIFIRRRSQSK